MADFSSFSWQNHSPLYVLIPYLFPYSFVAQHLHLFPNLGSHQECRSERADTDMSEILISFPLDICPEVGLLVLIIVLFLIFWGISILVFLMATPMYILISKNQGSLSPFPHQYWLSFAFFNDTHFNNCEVISHCGLICISLKTSSVNNILIHLLAVYLSLLLI